MEAEIALTIITIAIVMNLTWLVLWKTIMGN